MAEAPHCGTFRVSWQAHPAAPGAPFDLLQAFEVMGNVPVFDGALALKHLQVDIDLLREMLSRNPDHAIAMLNGIRDGDFAAARAAAEKLGIDERHFVAEGGGLWWLIFGAVALAYMLISKKMK